MATYVLIPGAASGPWYWHLLEAELRGRGHEVVAVDLPCDDDSAGLAEYADTVVDAIGGRADLILVAHSFGGFTAPLVCDRVRVDLLVMLQAQIPAPGETPGQWWANTGYQRARHEQDERDGRDPGDDAALFHHDTPPALAAEAARHTRTQSATPFLKPWPPAAWPDVPTRFLLAEDDRFLPAEYLRRIVRERLGMTPDELPGDHCPMLGHPAELADRLEAYRGTYQGGSGPHPAHVSRSGREPPRTWVTIHLLSVSEHANEALPDRCPRAPGAAPSFGAVSPLES